MSWKKTMRSISAAQKRAERDSLKRQRDLERQHKQLEKMEEIERAAYEVEVYENNIDVLRSVHKDCGETWDWDEILSSDLPAKPIKQRRYERSAQSKFESYKPGTFDKLKRRVETRQNELIEAVENAKKEDEKEFQKALEEHKRLIEVRELARGILAGEDQAYIEAIEMIGPFSEIGELGSSIEFSTDNTRYIESKLRVNSDEVIPKEIKSQLKSGKLSVKNMPKFKFYELYQDHVCGCVLRVARELFALLPIEMTIITAYSELLNTKTGYMEESPILSAAIPRKTLMILNFDALDPSDAMENFIHRMKFQKTKGFNPIEKIELSELQLNP